MNERGVKRESRMRVHSSHLCYRPCSCLFTFVIFICERCIWLRCGHRSTRLLLLNFSLKLLVLSKTATRLLCKILQSSKRNQLDVNSHTCPNRIKYINQSKAAVQFRTAFQLRKKNKIKIQSARTGIPLHQIVSVKWHMFRILDTMWW